MSKPNVKKDICCFGCWYGAGAGYEYEWGINLNLSGKAFSAGRFWPAAAFLELLLG